MAGTFREGGATRRWVQPLLALLQLWLASTPVLSQTALSEVALVADTSVTIEAVTASDHELAVDNLLGDLSIETLGLPASAAIEAYHRLGHGDQLFAVSHPMDLGTVFARPIDIIRFDGASYALEFDGAVSGIPAGTSIKGLSVDGNDLLLVFSVDVALSGFVAHDHDVVVWQGGAFSLAFNGQAAGLDPALAIDGLHRLANGDWLFSFETSGAVAGTAFLDEDIVEYRPGESSWALNVRPALQHPAWAPADVNALFATEAGANPGTIEWISGSAAVSEGGPLSTVLTAWRVGGNQGAVAVSYASGDLTALSGADYFPANGVLSWADEEIGPKTVMLTAIDDAVPEGPESLRMELFDPQGGATLGTTSVARVEIADDDVPPQGLIRFQQLVIEVQEDEASATVLVERVGGSIGTASIDFMTNDGTAHAGLDYLSAQGTLTWPDGVEGALSFDVTILNDQPIEAPEDVLLQLTNAAGAVLGQSEATLLILDDQTTLGIPTLDRVALVLLIGMLGIVGVVRLRG